MSENENYVLSGSLYDFFPPKANNFKESATWDAAEKPLTGFIFNFTISLGNEVNRESAHIILR